MLISERKLLLGLLPGVVLLGQQQSSPPIFGAYPTGGPIHGGTSVTIIGTEFGLINGFPADARCSWGDPRTWQQAVFAAQQADMDGWALGEIELPKVSPVYLTTPSNLRAGVPVTPLLREKFPSIDASRNTLDLLECASHEREAGDVALWFSLRFFQAEAINSTTTVVLAQLPVRP